MKRDIAVLLPSYRRKEDLENVLKKAPLGRGRFIVVANYPVEDFKEISKKYSHIATFIDETKFGKLGVRGAYNQAFKVAKEEGFPYCVLFADDVLPFKKDWLDKAVNDLERSDAVIGIFSSDEGHYGSFGWNIIKDAPIAHFFIARTQSLDYFFDPRYQQYVIDFEIAVRLIKSGKKIALLPVRVRHYRSPINRESYGNNYNKDLEIFLSDYPEYEKWIHDSKEVFVPEGSKVIPLGKGLPLPVHRPYPAHKKPSKLNLIKKIRGL